jgi:hypothetical protein
MLLQRYRPELLPLEEARLGRSTRRDPRALLAYRKGFELLNQRTGDDIYSAVTSFDEAARFEPMYGSTPTASARRDIPGMVPLPASIIPGRTASSQLTAPPTLVVKRCRG